MQKDASPWQVYDEPATDWRADSFENLYAPNDEALRRWQQRRSRLAQQNDLVMGGGLAPGRQPLPAPKVANYLRPSL